MNDWPLGRAGIERMLELLGGDAHVEVLDERQELLRFARSAVTYQHGEERLTVRVRLVRDGRSVWGTFGSLADEAVLAARARLEALAAALPEGAAPFAADPEPRPAARAAFEGAQAATAADRVELLSELAAALPAGAELGGSIADGVVHHAVANSGGLFRAETRTRSAVLAIGSLDGRSSYAKLVHRDREALLAELPAALARLREGLADLPVRELRPGHHRALLEPQALAGVVAPFAYAAFDGRAVAAAESAASDGVPLAAGCVDLVDDGADEAGLPTGFDAEGVSKRRVALLERGRPVGAVHDAASARETGAASTGHAVPPAWRFGGGPSVSHLLVGAGEASDEELRTACGSGLSLQRLDYLRILHPRETLATGSSRDATLWLEDGVPVARVPQFRFTVRLADVLRAVELLGARRERSEIVFCESVVAPGALVADFPVDATT